MVSTLTLGPYSMGVAAGLATALLWAFTSLCFEGAGRRLGSLQLNLVRLVLASGFFLLFSLVTTGQAFPTQAGPAAWGWLLLSGLVGFVLGDLFLFQAFVLIGARRSMLVYCSVPPLTALIGWVSLGETMRPAGLVGMGLTLAGIAIAIGFAPRRQASATVPVQAPPPRLLEGVLLAFGGSLGQSVGMVLGKYGAEGGVGAPLGSFAATQVRALAGVAGFALLVGVTGRSRDLGQSLRAALGARRNPPGAATTDAQEPGAIRVGYPSRGSRSLCRTLPRGFPGPPIRTAHNDRGGEYLDVHGAHRPHPPIRAPLQGASPRGRGCRGPARGGGGCLHGLVSAPPP